MYLTLTLNPSIDYFVKLPEGSPLLPGDSSGSHLNRAAKESFTIGGKGINVARILKRLAEANGGTPVGLGLQRRFVSASGFIGDFTGEEIYDVLSKEDISPDFIEVAGHTRINFKITDGLGYETEINGTGPAITQSDEERLISKISGMDFDTVFLSGSAPAKSSPDIQAHILNAIKKFNPNARLILDFDGTSLINCLKFNPFIIKPNLYELASLTGRNLSSNSSMTEIKDAAEELISKGALNVLVSLGARGACLIRNNGDFFEVSGIKGEVKSTVGSGDTMLASFMFWFDRTRDYAESLKFSNRCAALCAFSDGLPDTTALSQVFLSSCHT